MVLGRADHVDRKSYDQDVAQKVLADADQTNFQAHSDHGARREFSQSPHSIRKNFGVLGALKVLECNGLGILVLPGHDRRDDCYGHGDLDSVSQGDQDTLVHNHRYSHHFMGFCRQGSERNHLSYMRAQPYLGQSYQSERHRCAHLATRRLQLVRQPQQLPQVLCLA